MGEAVVVCKDVLVLVLKDEDVEEEEEDMSTKM